jgi:hypothetical protein
MAGWYSNWIESEHVKQSFKARATKGQQWFVDLHFGKATAKLTISKYIDIPYQNPDENVALSAN